MEHKPDNNDNNADNNAIKTLEHYKIINIDATLALNETRTVF